MDNYFAQAVSCIKDYVLPMQQQIYEKCGGDFDRIYGEALNNDLYTGKVIEPGHIYELGYHTCTCPKVLSGAVNDPEHCECTWQSILYIETSFRELKYTVGLLHFHTKKVEYIYQEVFARLIMYNFTELITSPVIIQKADAKYA